jgi:hypothetical protein
MKPVVLPVLLTLLLAFAVPAVQAQSNQMVDHILQEEELTYGSAAYLLLLASGDQGDEINATAAVARLAALGMELPGRAANETITLGEYSLLTMRIFGIPGGIMYTILPSPRYAVRELAYRHVVQGHTYPRMSLSGERGMRILGRVLGQREGGAL